MAINVREFIGFTGGGLGDLDSKLVATISDGDPATGTVDGLRSPYQYDASLVKASSDTNTPPLWVVPADNGTGTGAWVLGGFQGAMSHIQATCTSEQEIPNESTTPIVFNNQQKDSLGEYDSGTGEVTVKKTGTYPINASIQLKEASIPTGKVCAIYCFVDTGGGAVKRITGLRYEQQVTSTTKAISQLSRSIELTAGDVVSCRVYHDIGAPTDIDAESEATFFTLDRSL